MWSSLWTVVLVAAAASGQPAEADALAEQAAAPESFATTDAPPVELYQPSQPAQDAQDEAAQFPEDFKAGLYEALEGNAEDDDGAEPRQAPGGSLTGSYPYFKGLWALCIVLLLIMMAYYFLKKYGRRSPLFAGPRLGTLLGKVHIAPNASLCFVRIGERVLVLGVTKESVNRVAQFDSAMFETMPEETEADSQETGPTSQFLAELRASASRMDQEEPVDADDAEIASLRGELERLQRYLQDSPSESNE